MSQSLNFKKDLCFVFIKFWINILHFPDLSIIFEINTHLYMQNENFLLPLYHYHKSSKFLLKLDLSQSFIYPLKWYFLKCYKPIRRLEKIFF